LQSLASLHITSTDLTEQPLAQAEVAALNISTPNTMPPPPHTLESS
jgi:hypothetical protein